MWRTLVFRPPPSGTRSRCGGRAQRHKNQSVWSVTPAVSRRKISQSYRQTRKRRLARGRPFAITSLCSRETDQNFPGSVKKKKATRGSATNTLNCEKWTLCPKGDKRGKDAPCPLLAPMPQPSGPCRETSKRKAAEWGGGSDLLVLRGHDCVEDAKHLTKTVKTKTKPPRGEPGRRTQA